MSLDQRPILAPDLAGTVAYAGVDPTLEGRALQDALLREIAARRDYCWGDVDHTGWVVTLDSPRENFHGRTLEEGLACCLVWLMTSSQGRFHVGRFLQQRAVAPVCGVAGMRGSEIPQID